MSEWQFVKKILLPPSFHAGDRNLGTYIINREGKLRGRWSRVYLAFFHLSFRFVPPGRAFRFVPRKIEINESAKSFEDTSEGFEDQRKRGHKNLVFSFSLIRTLD